MSDQSGSDQVPATSPLAPNPSALWALGVGLASFVVGYVVATYALSAATISKDPGQLLPVPPAHQYVLAASVSLSLIAVLLALPSCSRRRANRSYGLLGMAVAILMLAWNVLLIIEWRMRG